MVERRKNELRYDRYGQFRALAFAEGSVMFRRKGGMAQVMSVKEWDELARLPELVSAPALTLVKS